MATDLPSALTLGTSLASRPEVESHPRLEIFPPKLSSVSALGCRRRLRIHKVLGAKQRPRVSLGAIRTARRAYHLTVLRLPFSCHPLSVGTISLFQCWPWATGPPPLITLQYSSVFFYSYSILIFVISLVLACGRDFVATLTMLACCFTFKKNKIKVN